MDYGREIGSIIMRVCEIGWYYMQIQGKKYAITLLVLMIITIPFIVLDVYFAHTDDCATLIQPINIKITLYVWLLVDGYTMLGFLIFLVVTPIIIYFNQKYLTDLTSLSVCILILYTSFRFSWLIVGSLIFWGNGSLYKPDSLTGCSHLINYMWAVLITNFISTGLNYYVRSYLSDGHRDS